MASAFWRIAYYYSCSYYSIDLAGARGLDPFAPGGGGGGLPALGGGGRGIPRIPEGGGGRLGYTEATELAAAAI